MVRAIAADREGVVGRAQLLERGVGGSAIDRALRSGTLDRLHPGVYSMVASELLGEQPAQRLHVARADRLDGGDGARIVGARLGIRAELLTPPGSSPGAPAPHHAARRRG